MPQQYYTLEQAAQILHISAEQLKEMARKKELRAFQDRSGWRFRSQEIDEMARERGYGSDPELPLGEAAKKGDSGKNDLFNFSLDPSESSEVPLGADPAASNASRSGSRKTGSSKSPPRASSDSDVRLVLDGNDMDFALDTGDSKAPVSKAPVSPAPKVGSSKSRMAPPAKDDSGVRIVPLDQPSDSDVKITPSAHDSDIASGKKSGKRASDSDIRIEEVARGGPADQNVTEEIDLDAEQRRADAARAKSTRHRPKPGSSPVLPTTSPFELSENDLELDGPTLPPSGRSARDANTDSSSDFELKPMADSSSPLELSDDEVNLGELTGGKNASGINLQDPADSGISLEQEGSSDEMELDLSLDVGGTPKPAPASADETDSSSDFELSLQDEDASPTEGSSEFELSLDPEGDLAVDEGSSDLALETPGSDSDSEFELTLDESGGLSVEDDSSADFEMGGLEEESGSEAVVLDEGDTDLESSEFDLSLEGEESGSQVVPLEDEEEYDEGAATVQRRAVGAADEEEIEDIGDDLDADLDEEPALEEEEEAEPVAAAPAPPAEWGVMVPLTSLLCTVILFVVGLMSFELIQGMWGYHRGTKVSNMIIHPIAKMFDNSLPDK
jgi:excisionase family DNA binding protein